MTAHDIEWINDTVATVDYSERAIREYEEGMGSRIEAYTQKFERDFDVSDGDDIGGIIVYTDSCVYDYENFCGWIK